MNKKEITGTMPKKDVFEFIRDIEGCLDFIDRSKDTPEILQSNINYTKKRIQEFKEYI